MWKLPAVCWCVVIASLTLDGAAALARCGDAPDITIAGRQLLIRGQVTLLAMLDAACPFCLRQAQGLNALRSSMQQRSKNIREVEFIIVNPNNQDSIDNEDELRKKAGNIPVFTEEYDNHVWNQLLGKKDDILIFDSCGRLAYHLPVPYSFVTGPYVKAALMSVIYDNPCGVSCSRITVPTTTDAPALSEENFGQQQQFDVEGAELQKPFSEEESNNLNQGTFQQEFEQNVQKSSDDITDHKHGDDELAGQQQSQFKQEEHSINDDEIVEPIFERRTITPIGSESSDNFKPSYGHRNRETQKDRLHTQTENEYDSLSSIVDQIIPSKPSRRPFLQHHSQRQNNLARITTHLPQRLRNDEHEDTDNTKIFVENVDKIEELEDNDLKQVPHPQDNFDQIESEVTTHMIDVINTTPLTIPQNKKWLVMQWPHLHKHADHFHFHKYIIFPEGTPFAKRLSHHNHLRGDSQYFSANSVRNQQRRKPAVVDPSNMEVNGGHTHHHTTNYEITNGGQTQYYHGPRRIKPIALTPEEFEQNKQRENTNTNIIHSEGHVDQNTGESFNQRRKPVTPSEDEQIGHNHNWHRRHNHRHYSSSDFEDSKLNHTHVIHNMQRHHRQPHKRDSSEEQNSKEAESIISSDTSRGQNTLDIERQTQKQFEIEQNRQREHHHNHKEHHHGHNFQYQNNMEGTRQHQNQRRHYQRGRHNQKSSEETQSEPDTEKLNEHQNREDKRYGPDEVSTPQEIYPNRQRNHQSGNRRYTHYQYSYNTAGGVHQQHSYHEHNFNTAGSNCQNNLCHPKDSDSSENGLQTPHSEITTGKTDDFYRNEDFSRNEDNAIGNHNYGVRIPTTVRGRQMYRPQRPQQPFVPKPIVTVGSHESEENHRQYQTTQKPHVDSVSSEEIHNINQQVQNKEDDIIVDKEVDVSHSGVNANFKQDKDNSQKHTPEQNIDDLYPNLEVDILQQENQHVTEQTNNVAQHQQGSIDVIDQDEHNHDDAKFQQNNQDVFEQDHQQNFNSGHSHTTIEHVHPENTDVVEHKQDHADIGQDLQTNVHDFEGQNQENIDGSGQQNIDGSGQQNIDAFAQNGKPEEFGQNQQNLEEFGQDQQEYHNSFGQHQEEPNIGQSEYGDYEQISQNWNAGDYENFQQAYGDNQFTQTIGNTDEQFPAFPEKTSDLSYEDFQKNSDVDVNPPEEPVEETSRARKLMNSLRGLMKWTV